MTPFSPYKTPPFDGADPDYRALDPDTYQRIANAIAFMKAHHRQQPDLKTLAAHVHLSESHFQRLFTAWAGISPKRFSQYLTVEYAKAKLASARTVLDVTADTGLSSPGRLHDLFVTVEAMSPGEYKGKGAGLRIRYGIQDTPFGRCAIATTARGICALRFLEGPGEDGPDKESDGEAAIKQLLQAEWPQAELVVDSTHTAALCDRIFTRTTSSREPLALHIKGTNFQLQVWRALLHIPFAEVTTYQGLAHAIGRPTAARAIGNAVGRNPVAYLIPCHRVIRGSGEMGGYRWGLDRKAALLGWEASQAPNADHNVDSDADNYDYQASTQLRQEEPLQP